MTKKVKQRNWPLEKFQQAVVRRAKKAGVKVPSAAAIKKAYEDRESIPYFVSKLQNTNSRKAA